MSDFDTAAALRITVSDQETCDYAGSALTACKAAIRDVQLAHEGGITDALHRLEHLRGKRDFDLRPLKEVEEHLNAQMKTWILMEKTQGQEIRTSGPGWQHRELWDVAVTDLGAFIRWVMQDESGTRLEVYVDVKMRALAALARERKTEGPLVPGVVARKRGSLAATGR